MQASWDAFEAVEKSLSVAYDFRSNLIPYMGPESFFHIRSTSPWRLFGSPGLMDLQTDTIWCDLYLVKKKSPRRGPLLRN